MNSDVIQGKWKQVAGDVKTFFGKLTDDDMQQINGNTEKMVGVLQERYGYSREQAQNEWNKFTKDRGAMWNDAKDSAHTASNDVKDTAHNASNSIKDATHDVKNAIKDKATDVKNAIKR